MIIFYFSISLNEDLSLYRQYKLFNTVLYKAVDIVEKVENSTVNLKNDDIQKIIGNNIRAIKGKRHLTGKEFYELIYPWKKVQDSSKRNKINNLVHGKSITIDDLVAISRNTNTPFLELFTGIDEKNKDTPLTAYDLCLAFFKVLESGRFNIEGTRELQKQRKVISFEKEKPELDKHYNFPACRDPDGVKKFDDYPQPIYIRIMPRYFLRGDNVIEYKGIEESLNFINGALDLYSCDLPEESKFRYIRSELEKVSPTPIDTNDYWIKGDYYEWDMVPPDYHEPW